MRYYSSDVTAVSYTVPNAPHAQKTQSKTAVLVRKLVVDSLQQEQDQNSMTDLFRRFGPQYDLPLHIQYVVDLSDSLSVSGIPSFLPVEDIYESRSRREVTRSPLGSNERIECRNRIKLCHCHWFFYSLFVLRYIGFITQRRMGT